MTATHPRRNSVVNAIVGVTTGGSGYSSLSTTATLASGSASCTGSAVANVTVTIGGYVATKHNGTKLDFKFSMSSENFAPTCATLTASTNDPFLSPVDIDTCLNTTSFNSTPNACDQVTCGLWLKYAGTQYSIVGYLAARYGLYAEIIPSEPTTVENNFKFSGGIVSATFGSFIGMAHATGNAGQWCDVSFGGTSPATGVVQLTGLNVIASGSPIIITSPGRGYGTVTVAGLSSGTGSIGQNATCGGNINVTTTTGTWTTSAADYQNMATHAFAQIQGASASTIRGFAVCRYDQTPTDYVMGMAGANPQVVGFDSYNTDYNNSGLGSSGCPCQTALCEPNCAGLGSIVALINEAQSTKPANMDHREWIAIMVAGRRSAAGDYCVRGTL